MKKTDNTLEDLISALVARSQLPNTQLEKKAKDLCHTTGKAYLESMAKLNLSEIKSGKLIDNLTSKTESLFRSVVLKDERLSHETREKLEKLVPYSEQRRASTLFIRP